MSCASPGLKLVKTVTSFTVAILWTVEAKAFRGPRSIGFRLRRQPSNASTKIRNTVEQELAANARRFLTLSGKKERVKLLNG